MGIAIRGCPLYAVYYISVGIVNCFGVILKIFQFMFGVMFCEGDKPEFQQHASSGVVVDSEFVQTCDV